MWFYTSVLTRSIVSVLAKLGQVSRLWHIWILFNSQTHTHTGYYMMFLADSLAINSIIVVYQYVMTCSLLPLILNKIITTYTLQQKIWNPTWPEQIEEYYETTIGDPKQGTNEENIGFRVKNAVLFPRKWRKDCGLKTTLFLIMLHKLLSFLLYSVFFSPIIIP